jgi:Kdo-III transferase WaaZ
MLRIEFICGQAFLVDGDVRFEIQDLDLCRGRSSGAVFLLASGASASDFPVRDYTQFPFVAMNGSIVRCIQDDIQPDFYICDDPNFVLGRPDLALLGVSHAKNLAMSLEVLQALHTVDPHALREKKIHLLVRANRYHDRPCLSDRAFAWSVRSDDELEVNFSLLRKKPNRIGFSRNLKRGYFVGRTIPYAGTQLAYHLGFNKVFIVGMDLTPSVGRFYDSSGKVLPTSLDEHYKDYIEPSFELLARRVCNESFGVFNLSRDSRLPSEILPKIDRIELDRLLGRAPC